MTQILLVRRPGVFYRSLPIMIVCLGCVANCLEAEPEKARELFTLKGHADGVSDVAFSPDGKTLASSDGNTIKLWDASNGKERITAQSGYKPLRLAEAFSPNSKMLAVQSKK